MWNRTKIAEKSHLSVHMSLGQFDPRVHLQPFRSCVDGDCAPLVAGKETLTLAPASWLPDERSLEGFWRTLKLYH
jgi:hypothetical protein